MKSKLALARRDHSRDRWRHLRSQGDFAPTSVEERIGLFAHDLLVLCPFCFIEFRGFENRCAVLNVTESLDYAAQRPEEIGKNALMFRIEIAHPPVRQSREFPSLFFAFVFRHF